MKSPKKRASEQDRRVSKISGFRIRPNSGAISGYKGDLGGPDIFVETKTRMTEHDYLLIQQDWIDKARSQAFSMGMRIYLLVISAGDAQDYVVIEHKVLTENNFGLQFAYLVPDMLSDPRQEYRIPLKRIDQAIQARRTSTEEPPCFRLLHSNNNLGMTIMYLEDFKDYCDLRQSNQNLFELGPEFLS